MSREEEWHSIKCKEKLSAELFKYISPRVSDVLLKMSGSVLNKLEEVRLRAEKPLMVHYNGKSGFVGVNGEILYSPKTAFFAERADIEKTVEIVSQSSIYAYQDEIRNGFITLRGGHRVGICGRAVLAENEIKNIKDFSGLTIRVSREVKGCSLSAMNHLVSGSEVMNTLIISPPGCGKTTLLRDIARILGNGEISGRCMAVGIIDERSEIAACYRGVPQNDVGVATDVLDACPKVIGMDMMIRSMSPQVLITDEIGNSGDGAAIRRVINAGVKIIASAHGYSVTDLQCRREVVELIRDKTFERYIVLSRRNGPGTIEEVADGSLTILHGRKSNVS